MKKTAKLIVTAAVVLCMIVSAVVPSFAAAAEEDLYAKANDGELIMKLDFADKSLWEPGDTFNSNSQMKVTIDAADSTKAVFMAQADKTQARWGGEIKGLPLTESTAYTVYYTITRDKSMVTESTKEPAIGISVDDIYGAYGYSYNTRYVNKGSTLPGHETIVYADKGLNVEGNEYSTTGYSVQHCALEVNGQSYSLKSFVMDTSGKYIQVNQTVEDDIVCFMTENLGFFVYLYYINCPITVSEVEIYKGMVLSGETLKEVTTPEETTKAEEPDTTKPVETSDPEVTTAAADADTTAAPKTDVTTAAPKTDDKKSGCGSSAAISAIVLTCGAAYVFSKRKK